MPADVKIILQRLISDMHFSSGSEHLLEKADKIADVLNDPTIICDYIVVAVTGDVALFGKEDEYKFALSFFRRLNDGIGNRLEKHPLAFVAVPGNHDCCFESPPVNRQESIKRLVTASLNSKKEKDVQEVFGVQDNFFNFLDKMEVNWRKSGFSKQCCELVTTVEQKTIIWCCYNTAWMSQKEEDQGSLIFPMWFFKSLPVREGSTDLVVSLFHHPYNWLKAENKMLFQRYIERTSDIILTGHEHTASDATQIRSTGEVNRYVAGDLFHRAEDSKSAFNIVLVDFDRELYQYRHYIWHEERGIYASDVSDDWAPYVRSGFLRRGAFKLSGDFEKELDALKVQLRHPWKGEELSLADVYVQHDIRVPTLEGDTWEIASHSKRDDEVFPFLVEKQRVIISGGDKAGKTCFLQMLYRYLTNQGLTPVLVSGKDLKSSSREDLIKTVISEFSRQYDVDCGLDIQTYLQLGKDKRALLIDDLDESLPKRYRDKLLEKSSQLFEVIVATASIALSLEESTVPQLIRKGNRFENYQLGRFGHRLRAKLIEKWVILEQEEELQEEELRHQIDKRKRLVDEVLGFDLTPQNPFVILMILSHGGKKFPTDVREGSLGAYYELLILRHLERVGRDLDSNTIMAFLAEIAYWGYRNKPTTLTREALEGVYNNYHKKYRRPFDLFPLTKKLTENGLLVLNGRSTWGFRYPYQFFYFLAKYIRMHLKDPEEGQEMESLVSLFAQNLHSKDTTDALMFLIYLSDDPIIVKQVLNTAREVWSGQLPADLTQDVEFLNTEASYEFEIALPKVTPDAARRETYELADEFEEGTREEDESSEKGDLSESTTASQTAIAISAISLLGLILRHFPGSIRGPQKLELLNEAYSLGQRLMGRYLQQFESFKEECVRDAAQLLKEERGSAVDKKDAIKFANRVLFSLSSFVVVSIIASIAEVVGAEALDEIYSEVRDQKQSPSVDLIDLAIRINCYRIFPANEILRVIKSLAKNPFAKHIAMNLVAVRMIYNPPEIRVWNSLLDKLAVTKETKKRLKLRSRLETLS